MVKYGEEIALFNTIECLELPKIGSLLGNNFAQPSPDRLFKHISFDAELSAPATSGVRSNVLQKFIKHYTCLF